MNQEKWLRFEDVMRNGKTCQTFYGPDSDSFLARNDAIVIGMRYDEFYENGLSDSEWDKLHDKQLLYLYSLLNKMNVQLANNSDIPISVLKYNEFSVRARKIDINIGYEEEEIIRWIK